MQQSNGLRTLESAVGSSNAATGAGSGGGGRIRRRRGVPAARLGVERQELVQEGVAGLLFAARRYDSRLNTPFWAYASFWVRKAMQELVAELARRVALSDRAARGLAQLTAARREHVQTLGREPTNRELSGATGLTLEQIESPDDRADATRPRGAARRRGGDRNGRRHDRRSDCRPRVRTGARQDRDPRGTRPGRPAPGARARRASRPLRPGPPRRRRTRSAPGSVSRRNARARSKSAR